MFEPESGQSQAHELNLQTQLFEEHTLAARLLPITRLNDLYRTVCRADGGWFGTKLLSEMQIKYQIEPADLEKIPKRGRVVVVANHPFGIVDGLILATLLPLVRSDVKIITNYLISGIPEMEDICLFVDPFGRSPQNRKALKEALSWLCQDGMVVIFPAGEVSHWSPRTLRVEDPKWTDTASRLIRLADATALPVYFKGRNSISFQALGLIHPVLRTARLTHEFLNARGKSVEVRIGNPIPAHALAGMNATQTTEYLRRRTYLLANRGRSKTAPGLTLLPKVTRPVAAQGDRERLVTDVARLRSECLLSEDRDFSVLLAKADEIPAVLPEIGRLRELTFRTVGEGTGKAQDLDRFDSYYHHLFVWNKIKQEVVGAYRIGDMREILALYGPSGLYTNTLFEYDNTLFDIVGDGLELGRSFVRPEYQRQYAPLLLLWKAIGRLVCTRPQHAILFGAVSISGEYSRTSRELLVNYYGSHLRSELSQYVRPRRSFRTRRLREWEIRQLTSMLSSNVLADTIADVEKDGKEIPILLKQYVKLGGELLGFNVDRDFSSVVDGLILVDLRKTNPTILERYMGKAGAASFLAHHALAGQDMTLCTA
jgi:putative hemolysin